MLLFADETKNPGQEVVQSMETSRDALMQSFQDAFDQMIQMGPRILAMLLVLAFGYVIAKIVSRIVTALCDKLGLQTAAERGGIIHSMEQVGIKRTMPQIIGSIIFWLLMLVFIMAAFKVLGLEAISNAMEELIAYIPKILVATVVVVVGLMVAAFLRGVIATGADRLGFEYAQQLASGAYYMLVVFTFIAAFAQIGIEFDLLNYAILIVLGAVALGFGLSVGLGGRDVMGGILAGYYVRQRIAAGDHVDVDGIEGVVREVGPVATIIETDENGMKCRRSIPNTKMLKDAVR
jgi:hypothetical protein